MITFVIAEDGTKLMPTTNVKKVRRLLRTGRAVICKHEPFTIKLCYKATTYTQPIEFKQDAGYQHIGVSVASQKHEYVSEERVLLKDEVEKHNDQRKYRRTRRNRKRYRAPRFDNRVSSKKEGWLAPSLNNKKNMHIKIFEIYNAVLPITSVVIEVAQFDTQILKAVQDGAPLPSGTDYQHGERYGYDTLREAVFARDNHTCIICKKNAFKDGAILRAHHLGFWKSDRTNRASNLATVCTKCHTSKNHKPGGKLYGLPSMSKNLKSAAFMNTVKYAIISDLRKLYPTLPIAVTFGVDTKRTRNDRNIVKSHANDAYCIGEYHPLHRAHTCIYQKRRRNNRVLERFYDSKVIDIRDGQIKSGASLSCGRTNRREIRNSSKNERIYRGEYKSKGRRSIRRRRYELRPGDIVLYDNNKFTMCSVHNNGTRAILKENNKSVNLAKLQLIKHIGAWEQIKI